MPYNFETIKVTIKGPVCWIKLNRPDHKNTINDVLIKECTDVLDRYQHVCSVVVLEGLPEVFCFGADFNEIAAKYQLPDIEPCIVEAKPIYELWLKLARGPFISVAHVRGKVNAGGVGFVAACNLVIADTTAQFSLSELLFGLLPACVLPFLIHRIGYSKAQYMTLMTRPISVQDALSWGLVDALSQDSDALLERHLTRLKTLSKPAIVRYKTYMNSLSKELTMSMASAIDANCEMFSDPSNLDRIKHFLLTGDLLPN